MELPLRLVAADPLCEGRGRVSTHPRDRVSQLVSQVPIMECSMRRSMSVSDCRMVSGGGIGLPIRVTVTLAFLAALIITPATRAQESKAAQDKVVADLEKRGGQVFRDDTQPTRPVIGVDLDETTIDDDGLSDLRQLTSLQSLSLDGTRITDAGLANLKD